MKIKLIIVTIFATLLFSSCSKFPQKEVEQAISAVDSLKIIGADLYVPVEFQEVSDSLELVKVKLESEKSGFFTSYKEEKKSLELVILKANDVKVKSLEVKTEMINATESLSNDVKALVETNKVLLTQAPKGKEGKAALVEIENELNSIEPLLTEVKTLLSEDKVFEANTKVNVANELAVKINEELTSAINKVK